MKDRSESNEILIPAHPEADFFHLVFVQRL